MLAFGKCGGMPGRVGGIAGEKQEAQKIEVELLIQRALSRCH